MTVAKMESSFPTKNVTEYEKKVTPSPTNVIHRKTVYIIAMTYLPSPPPQIKIPKKDNRVL